MKVLFVIYFDLEYLLEKMSTCHYNPEKSSTNKHKASGYSSCINCSFDKTKKIDCYRRKNCMMILCQDLQKHSTKIINYKKKKLYH